MNTVRVASLSAASSRIRRSTPVRALAALVSVLAIVAYGAAGASSQVGTDLSLSTEATTTTTAGTVATTTVTASVPETSAPEEASPTVDLTVSSGGDFAATPEGSEWSCSATASTATCEYSGPLPIEPGTTLPPIVAAVSTSGSDTSGDVVVHESVSSSDATTATATSEVVVDPIAAPLSATTSADAEVSITPEPVGSGPFDATITDEPPTVEGSCSAQADVITFDPAQGFSGVTSCEYTVTGQGDTTSAPETVAVTVEPLTDALAASTTLDTPVTVTPEPLGTGPFVEHITTEPVTAEGSCTVDATGTITFDPAAGFTGQATCEYTVTGQDSTTSVPEPVTITVEPMTDALAASTALDTPVTVTPEPLGTGPFVEHIMTEPATAEGSCTVQADGTITFDPSSGFSGIATCEYTATAADGTTSEPEPVTIGVDLPGPSLEVTTTADTTLTITPPQVESGTTIQIVQKPPVTEGSCKVRKGAVVFHPATGFSGKTACGYTATPEKGATSTTEQLAIAVEPVAAALGASTPLGTTVTVTPEPVGTGPFIVQITKQPSPVAGICTAHADGTTTFDPAAGFTGEATCEYTVKGKDNIGSAPKPVTITVEPLADSLEASTSVDTPVTVKPALKGKGPFVEHITRQAEADEGSCTARGATITFSPTKGFSGIATCDYNATGGTRVSSPVEMLTVMVSPEAKSKTASFRKSKPTAVSLPAPLGSAPFTYTVTGSADGSCTAQTNGTITYTPDKESAGSGVCDYTVTDGYGLVSAPATITFRGSQTSGLWGRWWFWLLVALGLLALVVGARNVHARRRKETGSAA